MPTAAEIARIKEEEERARRVLFFLLDRTPLAVGLPQPTVC